MKIGMKTERPSKVLSTSASFRCNRVKTTKPLLCKLFRAIMHFKIRFFGKMIFFPRMLPFWFWGSTQRAYLFRLISKKIPHWLLAAATGYGKTQLLLLMLHQLYMHDWIIYLADYKSVDYPAEYQTDGHYATDNVQLLSMLDTVSAELIRRRHLMSASGCNHLDVYNSRYNDKLRRIVVVLDETSMILDATGRDKNEKSEIATITGHLLTIGRLGRAMGIHLIIATQRPDVASVPGALKAQLDGRLCGHASDAQSSIVILDDGSGAKLPAIPGRFIVRDGTGDDKIIQAYLYQTNQIQNTGKE